MVNVSYWACDKEKGMYFVLNDSLLGLVLEGVNGSRVANFIYINVVNTIKYNYHSDRFVLSIEYKEFIVDERLRDEQEFIVEAMKSALEKLRL